MHPIYFYRNPKGESPVQDYLDELIQKKDKDSRIKFNKIQDYIKALSRFGKAAGQLYLKRIEGDILELRPLSDRIFFVAWYEDSFVLLHHFVKKTMKTPEREKERARKEYKDLQKRGDIS